MESTGFLHTAKKTITRPVLTMAGLYFTLFQRTFKTNGLEFHIPYDMTDLYFRGWFTINRYEAEERRYLKQYLRPNATVLELGACLGVVSCITNKLLNHPARHVVVEANPNLISWIEKNRDYNDCAFEVEHLIVSDAESVTFFIHDEIVLGSTKSTKGQQVAVQGITLSELEAKHNLMFDTLIMDIEGGELDFLQSNRDKLGQFRQVFLEVHPFGGMLTEEEVATCEALMQEAGLSLTKRDGIFQIWEKEAVVQPA